MARASRWLVAFDLDILNNELWRIFQVFESVVAEVNLIYLVRVFVFLLGVATEVIDKVTDFLERTS
jgi:hypothetical protein